MNRSPGTDFSTTTLLSLAVMLALFAAPVRAATTWYVDDNASGDPGPGDPTISDPLEDGSVSNPFDAMQEAIDASGNGDEVVVLDGTYTGVGNKNLDFGGRLITVRSDSNDAALCVIDCENDGRGFIFENGETGAAIVRALTITNGDVSGANDDGGGGMLLIASHPTLESCVFIGNTAGSRGSGGAIYIDGSCPTILGCTFDANTAGQGGGLTIVAFSDPILTDCLLIGNIGSKEGGAVFVSVFCEPVVTNCRFIGNSSGIGGAWDQRLGTVATITNCVFSQNSAFMGGEFYHPIGTLLLTNCTLSGNSAVLTGGGVHCEASADGSYINCIFWGNSDSGGMGGTAQINSAPPLVAVNSSCVQGGWSGTGGTGVIVADPLMVAPLTHDVHLSPGSPCIDAGDAGAPNLPVTDYELQPRLCDDPGTVDSGIGTPTYVDMGADEYLPCPADIDCSGVIGPADLATLLGAWGPNPGHPADLDNDGVVGPADLAMLLGAWGPCI